MNNLAPRLTLFLLALLLAGCGTFDVSVLSSEALTPPVMTAPASLVPTPFPSSDCPPFTNETVLPQNPDDPQSYIGHHYDELNMPEGLIFNGGSVLTDNFITEWLGRPDFDMQFIAQTACRDAHGKPYNTVVDAVKIPKTVEGYGRAEVCSPVPGIGPVIVFGTFDRIQPETVLLGIQGWRMYDIDFGVQINLQRMRFQSLALEGVECLQAVGLGG